MTQTLDAERTLAPAIEGLRRFVEETRVFPRLLERREGILSNLRSLAVQHENLRGSLLVLLLGGTGVGKSTLINALAGRTVAEVSAIRPCTRRITFYTHEENDLSPLDAVLSPDDVLATHRDAALERKILIDPPDFDSTRRENRAVLERILEVSDLVLVLVDREKYRNDSLYRLLARYRGEKRFLFLVNKTDVLFDPGIADDFRAALAEAGFPDASVLALSARAAAAGEAAAAGDFDRLQAVLREEMDRVRIREIKEANLDGLHRHVLAAVRAAIPAGLADGIERWRTWTDAGLGSVAAAARDEVFDALFATDRALGDFIVNAQAMGMGGVFGAYLLVLNRLRGLLRPGVAEAAALDPVRVRSEIARGMDRVNAERIERVVEAYVQRGREEARRLGVRPPPPADDAAPAAVRAALLDDIRARVSDGIFELVRDASAGRRFGLTNIAYNLLPFGLIGYVVATVLVRFWRGDPTGMEFLVSGLVLLVVLCALQGVVAEGGFRRHAARFLLGMGARIEALALDFGRRVFGAAFDAFAREVKDALARFEELEKGAPRE